MYVYFNTSRLEIFVHLAGNVGHRSATIQYIYRVQLCWFSRSSIRQILSSDNPPTWATEIYNQITNGQLKSTTRVKDAATTLWRQNSPSYDNKRAVQITSTEPGHTVRRKRKSSETEYQYRKRRQLHQTALMKRATKL